MYQALFPPSQLKSLGKEASKWPTSLVVSLASHILEGGRVCYGSNNLTLIG